MAQHTLNRRPIDHGFAVLEMMLEVLAKPATAVDPGYSTLTRSYSWPTMLSTRGTTLSSGNGGSTARIAGATPSVSNSSMVRAVRLARRGWMAVPGAALVAGTERRA